MTKTLPFNTVTEAIGGRFALVAGEADVGLTGATMLDFNAKAEVVLTAVRGDTDMEGRGLDSFMGLFEWVTRFLEGGADLCREGYQCRRASKGNYKRGGKKIRPSAGLAAAIYATMRAVDGRRFKPLVYDPRFWHGGIAVSADASMNDGFGLHVGACARQGDGNQQRSVRLRTVARSCPV